MEGRADVSDGNSDVEKSERAATLARSRPIRVDEGSDAAVKDDKDELTEAIKDGRHADAIQLSNIGHPGQTTEVEQGLNRDQSVRTGDADTSLSDSARTDGLTHRPRLRIAIVGGGIGGLALATLLASSEAHGTSSSDLDISIYEASPSLTELGAGVGVWLRTWRILSSAGLAADLERIAPVGRDMSDGLRKAFEFRRGDRAPTGRSFYTMEVPFGVLTLHRADFQRALARHAIPPAQPHFGKRLVGYAYADENDSSSEIILNFADGSTARTDLLVGADGIRSVVRREAVHRLVGRGSLKLLSEGSSSTTASKGDGTVITKNSNGAEAPLQPLQNSGLEQRGPGEHGLDALSDLTEPVWSGTLVYRNLIPLSALEARFPGHRAGRGPVVYFGRNKHVLAFPLSASANTATSATSESGAAPVPMVNLVAFTSDPAREGTRFLPGEAWVRPAPREEVFEKFEGWEDEVLALLELAEQPLLWAIHTVKPLPCYSDADGRVVLLGDAAHAMTPHQGAGGGQAIEDARVLAALLAHPRTTRDTLPAALRAYDAVRVPIAQRVVRSSRLNGMMYELNHAWDTFGEPADGESKVEDNHDCVDVNADSDSDSDPDPELVRLRQLAGAIMEIHRWEWDDEPAESQPAQAVRLFDESSAKSETRCA